MNTVVPVERLEAEGVALAPEILAQSPLAIRWLKAARFAFEVVADANPAGNPFNPKAGSIAVPTAALSVSR